MSITQYQVKLDTQRHPALVKQKTFPYRVKTFECPEKVVDMFNDVFGLKERAEEYFMCAGLSNTLECLGVFEISHGTMDASLLNCRGIFARLLLCGASNFLVAHNHTSGNPTPSSQDLDVTKRIQDCGKLMDIHLVDHIIIGDYYYSFNEHNQL